MSPRVAPEIAGCAERLGTGGAGVRLVLHVGHLVVVQVGAGSERLGTDVTLVRLLARVDSAVRVE